MSLHTYFSHNVAANIYVVAAGIEGFNLLHGIPHSDSKYIPPQEFPDYARDNIFACLDCANSTFSNEVAVKKEWNDWAQLYCPPTNNVHEYVQHLRGNAVGYHIPLKRILLDRDQVLNYPAWRDKPFRTFPVSNQTMFELPEVFSAAQHSVTTSMNLYTPASRVSVPRDE